MPPGVHACFNDARPPCIVKLSGSLPYDHMLFVATAAGLCLVSADTLVPAAPEDTTPITGYPEGSWINYTSWSPDGTYITFTTRSPGEGCDQRPALKPLVFWFACRRAAREQGAFLHALHAGLLHGGIAGRPA